MASQVPSRDAADQRDTGRDTGRSPERQRDIRRSRNRAQSCLVHERTRAGDVFDEAPTDARGARDEVIDRPNLVVDELRLDDLRTRLTGKATGTTGTTGNTVPGTSFSTRARHQQHPQSSIKRCMPTRQYIALGKFSMNASSGEIPILP